MYRSSFFAIHARCAKVERLEHHQTAIARGASLLRLEVGELLGDMRDTIVMQLDESVRGETMSDVEALAKDDVIGKLAG